MATPLKDTKIRQFSERLSAELEALPLWGMVIRDSSKYEWNPSSNWHRYQESKLGRRFSLRRYGNILLIIRVG